MKMLLTLPFALAVAAAGAQTTSQSQIRHVETSLNHLTVIEFGEPVTTLAIADTDSFQIERHDDKVFVKPMREGVSTNLFVWTASRELSYELDPAGQLASMDVLIRNEALPHPAGYTASEPSDAEIHKIASLVLTQAMMGTEVISNDNHKQVSNRVLVVLDQVYRSRDQLYIRYSISNQTKALFRLTTPDVYEPTPTQQSISIVGLRNHQLSPETFASFKAKPGSSLVVMQAESAAKDLAPGQTTRGVISIRNTAGSSPELYQLNFGADQNAPLTVAAVL